MADRIIIYTDGSSRGNPGPGGYGIVMKFGKYRKEISEGFKLTTNNRMELLAVIVALHHVKKPLPIIIYSDSKYVVDAIEKGWVFGWQKKNFKGKKNRDLWEQFLEIYSKHKITFQWVKGHDNNMENERCDVLAVEAALGSQLNRDKGYEAIA